MNIHETIKKAIPEAMRAKDEVRLRTMRSLAAAMMNELIAKKQDREGALSDEDALVVLKRAANQRKDSIEQFEMASRADLAVPETAELMIINAFLPVQMHRDEIKTHALAKMTELGITEKGDANNLIGALMKDLKGKADGNDVKMVVDSLLV